MKQNKLIPLLTVAAITISTGTTFADENTLVTLPSDVPTVIETPVEDSTELIVTPVTDSSSAVPIVSEPSVEFPTIIEAPVENLPKPVVTPITDSSIPLPEITETSTELEPDVETPVDATIPSVETPSSPEPEVGLPASQPGTATEGVTTLDNISNGQIISPIVTETGVTIVGTQGNQVIIQNEDGSQSTVTPESIGGTVNDDATISVTNKDGQLTILPNTGENTGFVATLIGLLLLGSTSLWTIISRRTKS